MHPTWNTWPHDPNWNAPSGPKGSKHTWHQQPDFIHLAISLGGQTLSHLQLSGTKDFCTTINPLRPQIPTLQSLPSRHSYEIIARTLHFHHPSMWWALEELFCYRLSCQKRQREHLIFSEPSDKSAMCMASAFRTSLRHFSLLTELKAQFNHNGVIFGFGSPLGMRHSSISLNRFMASFDT